MTNNELMIPQLNDGCVFVNIFCLTYKYISGCNYCLCGSIFVPCCLIELTSISQVKMKTVASFFLLEKKIVTLLLKQEIYAVDCVCSHMYQKLGSRIDKLLLSLNNFSSYHQCTAGLEHNKNFAQLSISLILKY